MMRRSVVRRPGGLIGVAARTAVVAGTATAVSGRVANRQAAGAQQAAEAAAFREQQAGQAPSAAPAPPTPEAPAAAPQVDVVGQLTQLAALRDSGVLTDAEFEAQKAKILAF